MFMKETYTFAVGQCFCYHPKASKESLNFPEMKSDNFLELNQDT